MIIDPLNFDSDGRAEAPPQPELRASRARAIIRELVVTERGRVGEPLTETFGRVAEKLAAADAQPLSVMVYARVSARHEIEAAMHRACGPIDWPVTWVDGAGCDGAALAGVQVFAVSGASIARVRLGRHVVASVYEDGDARHCLVGGLGPTALSLRPAAQAQQTFGNLEATLDAAGFELRDVVRTWFYNDDILAWYDEFNRVRSAFYANVPWRSGSLPASTGIGARNPAGARLTVAAWAVRPIAGATCAREIASPLQCPAPRYGSSFSRAMEIEAGGWRRLLVSGTASIHPDGRTAWVDNPRMQVELTMEVVEAILHSRGMAFRDTTRATAYFRQPDLQPLFETWCRERDLAALPVVSTHSVVCRDDLLFEIELDSAVSAHRALRGLATFRE
jgi:enamine deaminase RidA (YjgF/YER057c/UK114 family)